MTSSVPGRRNGFSAPFSKPQVIAWLVLAITALQFPFFVSPMLPLAASIPVTIVFYILICGILYYGGLTQAIDPIDVHLRHHLKETQPDAEAKLPNLYLKINPFPDGPRPEEPMKHCWLCETLVAEPSMHCKFCDKCVKNFDHHCMWLNTCIGRENYNYFFRTMIYIFIMQVMHIAIQIWLLVDTMRGGSTLDRANAWFNANAAGAIKGVWIAFIVFDGLSVFLIGQLLYFHILLQRQNLTTYSYIVRESHKRREKVHIKREIAALRTRAVTRANNEGRKVDMLLLQMGGTCRLVGCTPCDPLIIPESVFKAPGANAPAKEKDAKSGAKNAEQNANNGDQDENNTDPEFGSFANALNSPQSQQEAHSQQSTQATTTEENYSGQSADVIVPNGGVTFHKIKKEEDEQEPPMVMSSVPEAVTSIPELSQLSPLARSETPSAKSS